MQIKTSRLKQRGRWALPCFWNSNRGQAGGRLALRIIVALVTFSLGILASLAWLCVRDDAINRANEVRYRETSFRITVGMTKAEVIELVGAPDSVNLGKDGQELWWWQSHHRWERPLAYKLIGRSPYQGGPFLRISFDSFERVATVELLRAHDNARNLQLNH